MNLEINSEIINNSSRVEIRLDNYSAREDLVRILGMSGYSTRVIEKQDKPYPRCPIKYYVQFWIEK